MKDLAKSRFRIDIFSSMIYLSFGLLLFLVAPSVLETISLIIGIFILISGIIPIINYFKDEDKYFKMTNLISGILLLVGGIILIVHTSLLETIIAIMIGVIMLINSVSKIQYTLTLRDNKVDGWVVAMIFSIITLLVGLFFIINSFKAIALLTKTLGLIIIIYAIIDIIEIIVLKIKFKNTIKKSDEIIKVIDGD